jgi:hypothetical protein
VNFVSRYADSLGFSVADHPTNLELPTVPLGPRKVRLRSIIRENAERILYASHVEECGEHLFTLACELDLEGIVAKHRSGLYSATAGKRPGSRFGTVPIRRCRAGTNCLIA